MSRKRKGGEDVSNTEEQETKRLRLEGFLLPDELVLEIISYLPLPQIFALHALSKSFNNMMRDPTQLLWKCLVRRHLKKSHNNNGWNRVVRYGVDGDQFKRGKGPYSNLMGTFCWGKRKEPTAKDEELWIEEASNEKCRLIIQTWAIIEIWTQALPCPLYYPNLSCNIEPEMKPFYIWPDESHQFFEQFNAATNKLECFDPAPYAVPLKDFLVEVMKDIKFIFKYERQKIKRTKRKESEEEGGEKKEEQEQEQEEPDSSNFPRGSKAKWERFPSLFWENAKWTTMENPFTSWHGGGLGPWEHTLKYFWGQRKDNSVVGFIVIVDNS